MSIITPSARAVRPLPLLRSAKPILFASLILAVPMLAHAQEAEETGEPLYIVKGPTINPLAAVAHCPVLRG